jgi:hypothetical protein
MPSRSPSFTRSPDTESEQRPDCDGYGVANHGNTMASLKICSETAFLIVLRRPAGRPILLVVWLILMFGQKQRRRDREEHEAGAEERNEHDSISEP